MLTAFTASDRDEAFWDAHNIIGVKFVHLEFETLVMSNLRHVGQVP